MSVVSKRTIQRRIKKRMTRQQAESTPNTRRIQLTKDDFDVLSKIGISYRGAALILGVSAPCVSQKVKEYGIDWIGKDQKTLMQFVISVFCLGLVSRAFTASKEKTI